MRIVFFLSLLTLLSCSVKPEPLVYGADACYTCKMTLVDKKFGAELLTKKGKVYKFDDINCLVDFYESGAVSPEDVHSILAVDYLNESQFIDATKAGYVISGDLRTPMGSGVAVFADANQANAHKDSLKGRVADWSEVLLTF